MANILAVLPMTIPEGLLFELEELDCREAAALEEVILVDAALAGRRISSLFAAYPMTMGDLFGAGTSLGGFRRAPITTWKEENHENIYD